MDDGCLSDEHVIETGTNAAFGSVAAHGVEGLRRRQANENRDRAQAFQRCPCLRGSKAKGRAVAKPRQGGVSFGDAVRRAAMA